MAYSPETYQRMLMRLLPPGIAWPRDPDSVLGKLLLAIADALARVEARAEDLHKEADPRTTFELLVDWEHDLGLPDSCLGQPATLQERRQAVLYRLLEEGGQSASYFEALAADLGYTVTVSEYKVARAGRLRCGDRVYGVAWAHAWQVACAVTALTSFRAGQSCAGEPLRNWGNERVECAITARQPAHTIPIFTYAEE